MRSRTTVKRWRKRLRKPCRSTLVARKSQVGGKVSQWRQLTSLETSQLLLQLRNLGASLQNRVAILRSLWLSTHKNANLRVSIHLCAPFAFLCSSTCPIPSGTEAPTLLYPGAFLPQLQDHSLRGKISLAYTLWLKSRFTASASGLTPFSIRETHMERVFRSSPVFCPRSARLPRNLV